MNRPIRALATALLMIFAILALAAGYQQVIAGPSYREDLRNQRTIDDRATLRRGKIVTFDGVVIARSVEDPGDPDRYVREYPHGEAYAHVVGYSSPLFGDVGIEATRAADLTSADDNSLRSALQQILGADLRPHQVRLTISDELQTAAIEALNGRNGAVVAMDPQTGAILAMASLPTFDPADLLDPLSTATGDALAADPERPLVPRATGEVYPPGSTFKVVTAAAALSTKIADPTTLLPDLEELLPPGSTTPIRNAGDGTCSGGGQITLEQAIVTSCNTAFASLGMAVGGTALVDAARGFGFDSVPPFELETVASRLPPPDELDDDPAALAQNAIGERDVRATPLQMALVAAAVANEGVVMVPYVVAEILDADDTTVWSAEPEPWRTAVSAEIAADLAAMMREVVTSGTGTAASIRGIDVAGKTGTAQVTGAPPHVWFIGFLPADPDTGRAGIAVAVVVESASLGESASGGRVAAPIARLVLEAWIDSTD
jgi:peptidoglycan glycosyltransferase